MAFISLSNLISILITSVLIAEIVRRRLWHRSFGQLWWATRRFYRADHKIDGYQIDKVYKSFDGNHMKPSVADQEERIVVNVDGKLVEVILNEAARNTARDEYSHSFLASTITAAVQSIMSTGYVVGQILVDNISKTETEIRFYDACGQEIRRNVIPVIARSNAYSLGQDYLSRLERAGTMDPELLSKARAILEKGGEQRTD